MKNKKIGIICPSEIAYRRFLPALKLFNGFEYIGVAVSAEDEWGGTYTPEIKDSERIKAQNFVNDFGGKIYESYSSLISDNDIDSVYLPLPPALHYKWGKKALEAGKNLFLEKPSTTNLSDTLDLIEIADKRNLALHENYMFRFHEQLDFILSFVNNGKVGDLRLIRIAFGFPKRMEGDFRYNKALGGGALLDAGGYTVKLASMLLGESARVVCSRLNYTDAFDVDIFGSATMENNDGLTAQISFGMDNCYKCDLEIWGSKGNLFSNRIFTAPVGFEPIIEYKDGNNPLEKIVLKADDTFYKSIEYFASCIDNSDIRKKSYSDIRKQAELVEVIKNGG